MGEKRKLRTAYSRLSGLAKSFQFTLRQKVKDDIIREWKQRFFMFSPSWLSGPTQFSVVPRHLALSPLGGCYSMESSMTVCWTVSWRLPAPRASALPCRCNKIASRPWCCVYTAPVIIVLLEMEMIGCNLLFLSGDKDGLPALRVEDEAVCVSPWREDGCGVWEALGHPVLRLQRLVCCCR